MSFKTSVKARPTTFAAMCPGTFVFVYGSGSSYVGKGKGINSKCFTNDGKCIVACSKEYYRPLEVDTLLGNSRKAKKELNWKAKTSIQELVRDMVTSELKILDKNEL